ncbi:hypothetical protein GY45DRAFT_673388 [Cubamyces sp. BRFM 1775]|nr:hypothetical protein GY45DRAFT_673388 [Cubamyces sp. BRFM 1775]
MRVPSRVLGSSDALLACVHWSFHLRGLASTLRSADIAYHNKPRSDQRTATGMAKPLTSSSNSDDVLATSIELNVRRKGRPHFTRATLCLWTPCYNRAGVLTSTGVR